MKRTRPPAPIVAKRRAESLHINPVNGAIVALCNDGTIWIRDGAVAACTKPWRRVSDLPAADEPITPKESEDDATTLV